MGYAQQEALRIRYFGTSYFESYELDREVLDSDLIVPIITLVLSCVLLVTYWVMAWH